MDSKTLSLTGDTSILRVDYFPPIELGDGAYVCGLIDFQTFNSIPNVDETNNKFHFIDDVDIQPTSFKEQESYDISNTDLDLLPNDFNLLNNERTISIPTGSYEIEDINQYLTKSLGENIQFSLRVNNNTLKSEILCNRKINLKKRNTIGCLLGFSERVLEANILHESDKPINILKVNAIKVECNIITGAYANNKPVHTIHEFFPTVSPGFKIIEVPQNVIYLPVTVKSIHTLSLSIVDQDGNLVNFRGETITIRVHIKKID